MGSLLCVLWLSSLARADLKQTQEKFRRGDYANAEKELGALKDVPAQILLARLYLETGRYDNAKNLAEALAGRASGTDKLLADTLVGEIMLFTGKYAEAKTQLSNVLAKDKNQFRARWLLGYAERNVGNLAAADAIWESFVRDYNKRVIDRKNPEQVFFVAEASKFGGSFEDASDTYRDALELDVTYHPANVAWGQMFLEKFAPGEAEQSFDEILKSNPHQPDANAGLAAVRLEASYNLAEATVFLNKVFAVNPKHVGGLLLRAGLEIDRNEWDKAQKTIAQILAINPNHWQARSLAATIVWLRGDMVAYENAKQLILKGNPKFGDLYHIVAKSAVKEHRYLEAIALEEQTLAINPTNYAAMEALASGLLRLGEEEKGVLWLRKAWRGDQYNVRTKNLLDLYEDIIPANYEFASSEHFKVRYPKKELPVLRRYVEPLLEEAFAVMVKRYGFTPKTPIIVELYDNQEHYSVRTVGLPNLGALAVCFGQVITAMSPSASELNWAMVLWHELGHVFAIQLSKSKVPRWFTEGLSEFETVLARPEWRRENDSDLALGLHENTLPKVLELNYAFMKPDINQVAVAYHQASVTMEYIERNYGTEAIRKALVLYGQGEETAEVIQKITGKSPSTFDAEFMQYLRERLAPYKTQFFVPLDGYNDFEKFVGRAKAEPASVKAQSDLALAAFYEGDAKVAAAAVETVLAKDKTNLIALYVKAELALRFEPAKALPAYQALLDAGGDNFDVRGRLAQLSLTNREVAEKHICAARSFDPERSFPYEVAVKLYENQDPAKAQQALERYVMIEQMQYAPLQKLLGWLMRDKLWAKAAYYGNIAREINPLDGDLLANLGEIYLQLGMPDKAEYSFDSALLAPIPPKNVAAVKAGKARAVSDSVKLQKPAAKP